MSLPSAAKTPVRSVSEPSSMVLPETPRPTLTPPSVLVAESEDLVLQPEEASTRATDTSVTAAPRFVLIFISCYLRLTIRLVPVWCRADRRPRGPPRRYRVHVRGAADGARGRRGRRARRARR